MSAAGITQIALVMGSSTAGGAYVPAMSDETVIVRGTGTIFLGGPPLVKAATGEDVSAEELGGASVHARDLAASQTTRRWMTSTRWRSGARSSPACPGTSPIYRGTGRARAPAVATPDPDDAAQRRPTRRPLRASCRPTCARATTSTRSIARLVDGSEFHEFKAGYGETLVTGFAHIDGYPVGILANNGVLFSQSALKGAHFIELASQRRVPLVFLQNITGFMVGREYEAGGIAKDGAKLVTAVATPKCPSSRSSSAARSAPGTTAWPAARTAPRVCGCGPTRASA